MNRLASIPPRTLPVVQHGLFQAVDEGLGPEDVAVVGAEGDLFLGGCCMYIQIRGVKKGKRGSVFGGGVGRVCCTYIQVRLGGLDGALMCVWGAIHPPTHPPPPTHRLVDQRLRSIHPSTHHSTNPPID